MISVAKRDRWVDGLVPTDDLIYQGAVVGFLTRPKKGVPRLHLSDLGRRSIELKGEDECRAGLKLLDVALEVRAAEKESLADKVEYSTHMFCEALCRMGLQRFDSAKKDRVTAIWRVPGHARNAGRVASTGLKSVKVFEPVTDAEQTKAFETFRLSGDCGQAYAAAIRMAQATARALFLKAQLDEETEGRVADEFQRQMRNGLSLVEGGAA